MTNRSKFRIVGSTVLVGAALMLATIPGGYASHDHSGDHERAHRAVLSGRVLPLRVLLQQVEKDFQGEMIEAELDSHDGQFIYEIKLINRDGQVIKAIYDATNGQLLSTKERRR